MQIKSCDSNFLLLHKIIAQHSHRKVPKILWKRSVYPNYFFSCDYAHNKHTIALLKAYCTTTAGMFPFMKMFVRIVQTVVPLLQK